MSDRSLPQSKRKAALRKTDGECHFCGSEENVEVHHIDGDAANHDLDNLIPACRPCHMNIHYPDTERFQKWNDKIKDRDNRKTGDEIAVSKQTFDGEFICDECGEVFPSYIIVERCQSCDAYHSLSLKQ